MKKITLAKAEYHKKYEAARDGQNKDLATARAKHQKTLVDAYEICLQECRDADDKYREMIKSAKIEYDKVSAPAHSEPNKTKSFLRAIRKKFYLASQSRLEKMIAATKTALEKSK